MKNLQQLQQDFLLAVTSSNCSINDTFLSLIEDPITLPARERLKIYRNSIIEKFIKKLSNTFPVCQKLVGDEFFRGMSKQYIKQTSSHSPNLGDYGATFANFIATFAPAASLPYLADVARLEWLWERVVQGENNTSFDFRSLANVSEELQAGIIFHLPKNSFLLTSAFPVSRIWEIHQENYQGEFTVDFNMACESLFICKIAFDAKIMRLSSTEALFLQKIQEGMKLQEFNEMQINLLPQIVANGWIESFSLNTDFSATLDLSSNKIAITS